MATLAVGAKLPAMNVGMAIRTAGTRVLKIMLVWH